MRNRKVSRPAPVCPALPKNVRIASRRSAAFDRLTFWFTLTMFAGCAATAPMYVRLFLADAPRFEGVVLWWIVMTLVAGFAADKTIAAWNDACDATERLGRRREALASIRSSRMH